MTATLGLSIPYLAAKFDVTCPDLGLLFTLSGFGYFVGVTIASKVLDPKDAFHISTSRFVLLSLAAAISGLVSALLIHADELSLVKGLILIQVGTKVLRRNCDALASVIRWCSL